MYVCTHAAVVDGFPLGLGGGLWEMQLQEISVKTEEAATTMALGPLCCLPSMLGGAMSDHILCTVDQDSSSLRSLWQLVLRPTSSSTRFISTLP